MRGFLLESNLESENFEIFVELIRKQILGVFFSIFFLDFSNFPFRNFPFFAKIFSLLRFYGRFFSPVFLDPTFSVFLLKFQYIVLWI